MNPTSTILIVDDEPAMREGIGELLASGDYTLAYAGDGVEALAKASEIIPDLVKMDVMMPEMNGIEACRRLRADPTLAGVPVIIVTALGDRASRLRAIEAGADDLLTKPVDEIELLGRVRTTAKLNRYRLLLEEQTRRQQALRRTTNELRTVLRAQRDLFLDLQGDGTAADRYAGRNSDLCLAAEEFLDRCIETFPPAASAWAGVLQWRPEMRCGNRQDAG